jgi:ribosome biogenesis GTPase
MHTNENGCAILEAIEKEEIDKDSYKNFQRLQKERAHYESSAIERKKKDKDLWKLIKSVKKERKRNKY